MRAALAAPSEHGAVGAAGEAVTGARREPHDGQPRQRARHQRRQGEAAGPQTRGRGEVAAEEGGRQEGRARGAAARAAAAAAARGQARGHRALQERGAQRAAARARRRRHAQSVQRVVSPREDLARVAEREAVGAPRRGGAHGARGQRPAHALGGARVAQVVAAEAQLAPGARAAGVQRAAGAQEQRVLLARGDEGEGLLTLLLRGLAAARARGQPHAHGRQLVAQAARPGLAVAVGAPGPQAPAAGAPSKGGLATTCDVARAGLAACAGDAGASTTKVASAGAPRRAPRKGRHRHRQQRRLRAADAQLPVVVAAHGNNPSLRVQQQRVLPSCRHAHDAAIQAGGDLRRLHARPARGAEAQRAAHVAAPPKGGPVLCAGEGMACSERDVREAQEIGQAAQGGQRAWWCRRQQHANRSGCDGGVENAEAQLPALATTAHVHLALVRRESRCAAGLHLRQSQAASSKREKQSINGGGAQRRACNERIVVR